MEKKLIAQIRESKKSIVAIGFSPTPERITILGSGFFANGKIISAAHLLNGLSEDQIKNLKANVLVETIEEDVEKYQWLPIAPVANKVDGINDFIIFELTEKAIAIPNLILGDSDKINVGQEIYFIGFPYAAQLINDGFGPTLIVNKGIISNIKKDANYKRSWLILDAIANPGNSGCPVIDIGTNEVIGTISIAFRTKSQVEAFKDLDIREPMHIAGAKPINLVKTLL